MYRRRYSTFTRVVLLIVVLALTGCAPISVAAPLTTPTAIQTAMPADTAAPMSEPPTATLTPELPIVTPTSEPLTATPTPTPTPVPPTETPTPTPTLNPWRVSSLEDVRRAVVRIEAHGSFIDPYDGDRVNAVRQGSGFFIDESGTVVTNNHVVTGAAFFRVWVDGKSEPLNARILGVSECSDVAILDVDGEGFSYIPWYDGPIDAGLEVYAAGFPLGEPELRLTHGNITTRPTGVPTIWASPKAVIEHTAQIHPGCSGGPLVTKDGQVVGANYAHDLELDFYLAIARDEVIEFIAALGDASGRRQYVDSIGVNGVAMDDMGIWVASVAYPSSPQAASMTSIPHTQCPVSSSAHPDCWLSHTTRTDSSTSFLALPTSAHTRAVLTTKIHYTQGSSISTPTAAGSALH